MVNVLNRASFEKSYFVKYVSFYSPYAFVIFNDESHGYLIHKDKRGFYIKTDNNKKYFNSDMLGYLNKINVKGIDDDLENRIMLLANFERSDSDEE